MFENVCGREARAEGKGTGKEVRGGGGLEGGRGVGSEAFKARAEAAHGWGRCGLDSVGGVFGRHDRSVGRRPADATWYETAGTPERGGQKR